MASLYVLGAPTGETTFVAPAELGKYRISLVRDFRQIVEGVPMARSDKEFLRLASQFKRRLATLGHSKPLVISDGATAPVQNLGCALAWTDD